MGWRAMFRLRDTLAIPYDRYSTARKTLRKDELPRVPESCESLNELGDPAARES